LTASKDGGICQSSAHDALRSTFAPALGLSVCARGVFTRQCRPNCQRSRLLLRCCCGDLRRACLDLSVVMFTTKVGGPIHQGERGGRCRVDSWSDNARIIILCQSFEKSKSHQNQSLAITDGRS
jgi:hypothetical protein